MKVINYYLIIKIDLSSPFQQAQDAAQSIAPLQIIVNYQLLIIN